MVGRTLGHYTILSELGAGAMGRVYLARDTLADRRVALKFVSAPSPEARERLIREARAAARLSHPNVVTLHTVEEVDGELFLVQELVEGEPLAARLGRGSMGPQEMLRLARELAAALAHAHGQGVLHRDLKPENVLLAADGTFKIADFGIARLEGAPTMTEAGAVIGTLPYMAPERLRGHPGDARADLFALGAILYEAMSGRRAFAGKSPEEVMHAILNEDPPPPESRLPQLEALVHQLLAKEPRDRPASAEVVRGILEGMPSTTRMTVARRRRTWVVAAAAGLIPLLGLGFWWGRERLADRAEAAEPALAVLYFENIADPADRERIGPITGSLLVTSLAQTEALNVLGTQRILDALRQLGRGHQDVDRGTALEVARRARATRIITGTILQTEPRIVLTAEIADVRSGKVLDAVRVEGQPGETVFQVVDALSSRLLHRMTRVPEGATFQPVAQRGSGDLEAHRRYLEGLEALSGGRLFDAIRALQAALRRDPEFAQAHYALAIAEWWNAEPLEAQASIANAQRFATRLSPLEREMVQGMAQLAHNEWESGLEHFRSMAARHPNEKLAHYGLVESAYHSGRWQETIPAARRVLELDPGFAIAGVHLIDALRQQKKYLEADSLSTALLARQPRAIPMWNSRFELMVEIGDREKLRMAGMTARNAGIPEVAVVPMTLLAIAEDSLDVARRWTVHDFGYKPWESDGRLRVAYEAALRRGHFRKAVEISEEAWRRLPLEGQPSGPAIPGANGADALIAIRDRTRAGILADSIGSRLLRWQGVPRGEVYELDMRIWLLTAVGDIARAQSELRHLEAHSEARKPGAARELGAARAILLHAQGRHREALGALEGAAWFGPPYFRHGQRELYRARILAALGRHAEALSVYQGLLRVPAVPMCEWVRIRLERGRELEALGRPREAEASYRELLELWRDADPGTREVEEVRAAVRRLERAGLAATRTRP